MTPPPLESRLERVEQVIAALSREVAAIRAELAANGASRADGATDVTTAAPEASQRVDPPVDAPPAAPKQRRARTSSGGLDIEALLGRYGMLGIAVTAAVAAVGTFLNWAITHGYLSLSVGQRVLLGLAFAAAIGVWGVVLRRRERSFGSSVLGLALVIVLVCAYTAGPGYHLVPTWLAFVGSAAVSWTLAVFARGEDDEPLWCVAFGGATLAPFVTSDGKGNLFALVAYAVFLCVSASFAISGRIWPIAWRIFYASTAVLCIASDEAASLHHAAGFFAAYGLPLAIAIGGVIPFAPDARKRGALRWMILLTLLATSYPGAIIGLAGWRVAPAALGAAMLWLFVLDRMDDVGQSSLLTSGGALGASELYWIDVAAIPAAFVVVAAFVTPRELPTSVVLATAAAMFLVFAWRRPVGAPRDAAGFACIGSAIMLVAELPFEQPLGRVVALLALTLATIPLHRARPSVSWLLMGVVALAFASVITLHALTDRSAYTYPPFTTEPSLAAASVILSLIVVARFWRWVYESTRRALTGQASRRYANRLCAALNGIVAAPWIAAFIWVLIELSMAYSASTSTLLLVTYFAATAVACVAAGRSRRSARIRLAGLCLAVVAAVTAVYGASTYFDSAMRIAAYLVTSVFLLGIAYWYRRPGVAPAHA